MDDPVSAIKRKAQDISTEVRRSIWGRTGAPDRACFLCETVTSLHAHHIDYFHPDKLIWLCPTCHYRFHTNWKETELFKQNCHKDHESFLEKWGSGYVIRPEIPAPVVPPRQVPVATETVPEPAIEKPRTPGKVLTLKEFASMGGKARQKSLTPEQRSELTSKAGKASAKAKTPEQRKSFSQKGVEARAERRAKKNGK